MERATEVAWLGLFVILGGSASLALIYLPFTLYPFGVYRGIDLIVSDYAPLLWLSVLGAALATLCGVLLILLAIHIGRSGRSSGHPSVQRALDYYISVSGLLMVAGVLGAVVQGINLGIGVWSPESLAETFIGVIFLSQSIR